MSLSVGARLGPYEILSLIGAGGMGEVYRAKDTRLNRTVAIKILPENAANPDGDATMSPTTQPAPSPYLPVRDDWLARRTEARRRMVCSDASRRW